MQEPSSKPIVAVVGRSTLAKSSCVHCSCVGQYCGFFKRVYFLNYQGNTSKFARSLSMLLSLKRDGHAQYTIRTTLAQHCILYRARETAGSSHVRSPSDPLFSRKVWQAADVVLLLYSIGL